MDGFRERMRRLFRRVVRPGHAGEDVPEPEPEPLPHARAGGVWSKRE
jgi:hypothetical protein